MVTARALASQAPARGLAAHGQPLGELHGELDALARETPGAAPARAPLDDGHPRAVARHVGAMFAAARPVAEAGWWVAEEVREVARGVIRAPSAAVCVLTGSGSESVLLALAAARRATGRDEVLAASSAHPALQRAAALLGMTLRRLPVDERGRADPGAFAAALSPRTALVFLSAPAWATGVTDPIREISVLAAEQGAACHVDAAIGGCLFPFLDVLDRAPPRPFEPGVSSVSADLHKFGYAPPKLSALCIADAAMAAAAAFRTTDWDGFAYDSPALGAERAAVPVVGAWAVQRALGAFGYAELGAKLQSRKRLALETVRRFGDAAAEPFGHVAILKPSRDVAGIERRLAAAQSPHRVLRGPGLVRVRLDALADDATFATDLLSLREALTG